MRGRAVAYYASKDYAVFVPVSDVNRYDLIAGTGARLLRVEVKTTDSKRNEIRLRVLGGNRSWEGSITDLSEGHCDVVSCVNLATSAE